MQSRTRAPLLTLLRILLSSFFLSLRLFDYGLVARRRYMSCSCSLLDSCVYTSCFFAACVLTTFSICVCSIVRIFKVGKFTDDSRNPTSRVLFHSRNEPKLIFSAGDFVDVTYWTAIETCMGPFYPFIMVSGYIPTDVFHVDA